jgi:2-methylcitrate dehydratase PrpD
MIASREVTRELAKFAVRRFDAIPQPALQMGKQMILNALGLALGAAYEPALQIEYAMVEAMQTPAESTVVGRGVRVAATWAAFLNGTGIHFEDFDDSHYRSKIKLSGPAPAAALAMAEYLGASGQELIEAVVIGSEVAIRVLCGFGADVFRWHPTGTAGHLGAAVAAGRLAGFDEEQMLHALGIAATQGAGTLAARSKMSKPLQVGKAAFQGIEAVQMAQLGFTGSPVAIEGPRGFAAVMRGAFDEAACFEGLGERWEIVDNVLKPYACGVLSHSIIDATIALREHFKSAEEIQRIDILTYPMVLQGMAITEPHNGLESKFSAYHCAAIGFLNGHGGPKQFSDSYATAPDVAALRGKIRIATSPEVGHCTSIVTAHGVDGRIVKLEKNSERVMSQGELERKVRLLAGDRVEPLLRVIARLETLDRLDELIAALPIGP